MTARSSSGGPLNRQRRALITGGTGFIGAHLVRALVEMGWEVHVLTRRNISQTDQIFYHRIPSAGEPLIPLFERIRPDVVFHLATCFVVDHRTDQIADIIESNLLFGTHLLEGMAASGVQRILNTGTAWQHMVCDSSDYHPANLYAATKQAFESILDFYCEVHSLAAISLKLFDSYGPGDDRPKLLNVLVNRDEGAPPLELSRGEQRLNLVHVADVVEALLQSERLLSRQEIPSHRRYVLGGVTPMHLKEIVETLESLAGRRFNVIWGAKQYRPREIMEPWTQGTNLPGWHPQIPLRRGLRDLLRQSTRKPR
jgi:nucleoside-diphosphate-sugar epimerase